MPPIIITCPACQKRYKANKIPSSPQTFKCKCGFQAPLASVLQREGLSLVTNSEVPNPMPPALPNTAPQIVKKTKVKSGASTEVKAYFTVLGNGAKFVLTPGVYIVGRQSSDSMATLQLAPDIAISRQHARLVVRLVGGKIMAQILNLKSDNPIIINGKALTAGQTQTLRSGDRLQFGTTSVVYTV